MTTVKPRNLCTLAFETSLQLCRQCLTVCFAQCHWWVMCRQASSAAAFGWTAGFFRLHCCRLGKENILFWEPEIRQLYGSVRRASSSLRLESLPLRSHSLSSGRHPSVLRGAIQSVGPVWLRVVSRNVGVMGVARHSWWMTAASRSFTDGPSACGCFSFIFTLLTFPSVELCRNALVPLKNETAQLGVVQMEWRSRLFQIFCTLIEVLCIPAIVCLATGLLWYFRSFVALSISRRFLLCRSVPGCCWIARFFFFLSTAVC